MAVVLDMEHRKNLFAALATVLLLITAPYNMAHASQMQETKVRLQSDLQKHIYRSLVDGAFHTLDSQTGEVKALYPRVSHPMILTMGKYYVMCADFRDEHGNDVDIDFYMIRKARGFQVFRAEVNNHELLESMMKSGKAKVFE